mmetsp:Transcript_15239/g.29455  ORF Transcript_15239/g.29455 Transcript_15239/m.29455 type:complete len:154 (-) Transcript_15239:87-548(-)|eukprot:CAMPEP_0197472242 /NCGR_PEP_ID=MMETSP1309-20131121/3431_1 /TAXON_ID=464262 /ORGANISM="Genus nov. species nov., Strain RCC998" /LENGTH=153 /DNA_ID=CAMNT_0043010665 /DNA_START=513 /DNA_END=974 /DNA_ORIENTATION=+
MSLSSRLLGWSRRLGDLTRSVFGSRGELVGKDSLGNHYYKKMGIDPDDGVEKEYRWMESPRGHNHVYNYDPNRTPVEWNGWLRGSRQQPPTEQELARNEMYRKQVQVQVKELKVKEQRRRRIKEEEDAEKKAGETLTIEDSGDTTVEYWTPGK